MDPNPTVKERAPSVPQPLYKGLSSASETAAMQRVAADILRLRKAGMACMSFAPFTDSAWNVLLALCAMESGSRSHNIRSVSKCAAVPRTTTIRCLQKLQDSGLVTISPDRTDRRSAIVELTDLGRETIARTFISAQYLIA